MVGATLTRYDALRWHAVEAMKRRSRAGQRPARARPRKALKRKGGSAPKAVSLGRSSLGQTEVARLTREWDEALAQQAATADVLQTISSSPGNLDTVLETILANSTRLCEANFGVLLPYESAQFCCNGKPLKSWVIFWTSGFLCGFLCGIRALQSGQRSSIDGILKPEFIQLSMNLMGRWWRPESLKQNRLWGALPL
jgi:hypothetical protein